jgi:hypothetical protein
MKDGILKKSASIAFAAISFFLIVATIAAAKDYTLTVNITPASAQADARWGTSADNITNLCGVPVSLKSGSYTIYFNKIEGYLQKSPESINLAGNMDLSVTFVQEPYGSITRPDRWPFWPSNAAYTDITNPTTLTSIGTDVVAWLDFSSVDIYPEFLKTELHFFAKVDDPSAINGYKFVAFDPSFSASDPFITVPENTARNISEFSNFSALRNFLQASSVFKEYDGSWMSYNSSVFPNEAFFKTSSEDTLLSQWISFNRGSSSLHFNLADSGHAPAQIIWQKDPWYVAFLGGAYTPPSGWTNKIYALLSTNQGALHSFEIATGTSPSATRQWLFMPYPAFSQSIYHEVKRAIDTSGNKYRRMTVLDGPFSVRDVESGSGTWKRVLIGTTGLGTSQASKALSSWKIQGTTVNPDPAKKPKSDDASSRVFGIYAVDMTTPASPVPLWSVTTAKLKRTQYDDSTQNETILKTWPETIGSADLYQNLKFAVSKPVIGYTKNGTAREWHAVFVGLTNDNKYAWYDVNPVNGSVRMGIFQKRNASGTLVDETASSENYEINYPSRILSAFPYNGTEPVMSDVYVQLSSGSIYKWDVSNNGVPQWKITILTSSGTPAYPVTDFDIAYNTIGEVQMACILPLDFNNYKHDTDALIAFNLDTLLANHTNTDGTPKYAELTAYTLAAPPGLGDEKFKKLTDYLLVQLQSRSGNDITRNEIPGSPVFINNRLFVSVFVENQKKTPYTLYQDVFGINWLTVASNTGNKLIVGDINAGADLQKWELSSETQKGVAMFVDSQGNLVLLDEAGNRIARVDNLMDYTGTGGGGSSLFSKMNVIYWKKN